MVTTISDTMNAFLVPHIQQLVASGHQVELACQVEEQLDQSIKNLPHHDLAFRRTPFALSNLNVYRDLRQLLIKEEFDLVHTHTPVASALVRLAARKLPVQVMYTAHGFHFYKGAPLRNWLLYYPAERWLAKHTDQLITINGEDYQRACSFSLRQGGKAYQIPGIGTELLVSSPDPEQVALIRVSYGLMPQDTVLIFPAELIDRKNQRQLIEVIAELAAEGRKEIKLLLLGEGENLEHYQQLIQARHLERQVFLVGYRKNMQDYFAVADCLISSSKQEGLPKNLMEALAYGLPIIATKIRGHTDLIIEQQNGILVKDRAEMKAAILDIREAAKNWTIELDDKYSVASSVTGMIKIYEEAERKRRGQQ